MQVLVVYYSKAGKTKKIAEYIAGGVREVEGVDCLLKPVSEATVEDFTSSKGVIAGSPVYMGSMAAQLKDYFERLHDVRRKIDEKVGAAFATSGDPSGGKETTMFSILQALIIMGMVVVGDPMDATGHYGVSCAGIPDEKVLNNASKLGKRVASLAKKLE